MPTILQLRRGTTAENAAYTGSVGELTVDTELTKLLLHDGSTAGGVAVGIDTKNIQIGVTGNNEIDTSTGNLTIDSAGGTTTLDDNVVISGNLTVSGTTTTVNSTTIDVQNSLRFEGSTSDDYETTLTVTDPTADRTITLPNATGNVAVFATAPTAAITDGSAGQFLKTNGSGALSFATVSTDLVADTTPQLGGDLDINGNSIVSVSNGNIAITPNGSGNIILDGLTFPNADGSADQVLKTDGSGTLSFTDVSGGTSWQAVKTSNFTAVAGEGYFINTTSAAITMTLPSSPSQGDEVAFVDYAGTADTNNITIARNGSNIAGAASDLTVSVERAANSLVYVDSTQGWLLTSK